MPNQARAVLNEATVAGAKGGGRMAINIELAYRDTFHENGRDNLGLGFQGARQVAGIGIDVIDYDRLSGGYGGAADSLVQENVLVRRLSTDIRA